MFFEDPNLDQEAIIDGWWYDYGNRIARISYVFSYKSSKQLEYLKNLKELVERKNSEGCREQIENFIDLPIANYEYEIVGGASEVKVDNYYLRMLKMEYLDALRDAKRELNSHSESKLLYRILNDRKPEKYEDIKTKIIELENTIKQDKKVLDLLKKDIGDYLDKISLETETSKNIVEFQYSSIELAEILKKIGLQYGDNAISIEKNGLGRNNLLYIAVVLAHLYEKEDYFRVVAIEEPESHLCPVVQKHLANNIELEEGDRCQQLIVTTHSTHIASYLELKNTVVLYMDDNEVKYHYLLDGFNDKVAEDRKVINYLQKWLNATNSTMFFTRKIIFVEGIAEELLLPTFYEWKYGKTLEKVNCQIINVNGVAFENFLRVVKNGYFVKCAVITDSDVTKKTSKRAPELKSEYDSDTINVCISNNEDTFEKEIFWANKSNKNNRTVLLDVLKLVRPTKCDDAFKTKMNSAANFKVEDLFKCIEHYKSEFAFELVNSLNSKMDKQARNFVIPQYILDAFDFIND